VTFYVETPPERVTRRPVGPLWRQWTRRVGRLKANRSSSTLSVEIVAAQRQFYVANDCRSHSDSCQLCIKHVCLSETRCWKILRGRFKLSLSTTTATFTDKAGLTFRRWKQAFTDEKRDCFIGPACRNELDNTFVHAYCRPTYNKWYKGSRIMGFSIGTNFDNLEWSSMTVTHHLMSGLYRYHRYTDCA